MPTNPSPTVPPDGGQTKSLVRSEAADLPGNRPDGDPNPDLDHLRRGDEGDHREDTIAARSNAKAAERSRRWKCQAALPKGAPSMSIHKARFAMPSLGSTRRGHRAAPASSHPRRLPPAPALQVNRSRPPRDRPSGGQEGRPCSRKSPKSRTCFRDAHEDGGDAPSYR